MAKVEFTGAPLEGRGRAAAAKFEGIDYGDAARPWNDRFGEEDTEKKGLKRSTPGRLEGCGAGALGKPLTALGGAK